MSDNRPVGPGWYEDPVHPGHYRRWDGLAWTDDVSDTMPATSTERAAGWFEDPVHSGRDRYWDGTQWTDETRDQGPVEEAADTQPGVSGVPPGEDRSKRTLLIVAAVAAIVVAGIGWWAVSAFLGGGSPSTNDELADWLDGDTLECSTGEDAALVLCAIPNEAEDELAAVFLDVEDGVYEISTFSADISEALGGDVSEVLDAIGEKSGWWTPATTQRMLRTRALDGTGSEGDVSWTYHPDNGLQIVVGDGS